MTNKRDSRRRPAEAPLPPLLRIPYQAFIGRLHDEMAAAGYPEIRPVHGIVFQQLSVDGSRVDEVAERSQVTKQWMGALVDQLEAYVYLARVPDPTDGRAKIVRLTEKGWEMTRVVWQISARIEREWIAQVGERRYRQFRRSLGEMIELLGLGGMTTAISSLPAIPERPAGAPSQDNAGEDDQE